MENNLDLDHRPQNPVNPARRRPHRQSELAEAVACRPPPCWRGCSASRAGYILGYEARLNPMKLGAGMLVFIRGAAGPHHAQRVSTSSRRPCRCMRSWNATVAAGSTTCSKPGPPTWRLPVFAGNVLRQLPGVRETRTLCGDGRVITAPSVSALTEHWQLSHWGGAVEDPPYKFLHKF